MVDALGPADPQQVGKYRLLGRLGSGGMGRVFLGRSPGGRLVAVKLIRAELASDPDFRGRFAREVATARTVSGIFTVPVVDADLEGPEPWLVTAYVDGPSLTSAVAAQGPLPAASVQLLAAGLAEGLGVIHAAGVIHRDLKPSNVLLASDGPRIIDFGISRATDASELTRAGWVAGSPGFMSPEQAEGSEAGPASDIFGLGGVLLFAATGAEPFGTGPAAALLYRVVHAPADVSRLPASLRPLVESCLAKDPRLRPTTGQILALLGPANASAGWQPGPVFPSPAAQVPPAPAAPHAASPPARVATEVAGAFGTRPPDPLTATSPRPLASHDAVTRPGWPAAAGQPGRRRAGRTWAAAALATVIALAAVVFYVVSATSTARPAAARQHASPSAALGNPAWVRYHDPSGFSIKLPPGWAVTSRTSSTVNFMGPLQGVTLLVGWTTQPQADQYTDWIQQSAQKSQDDGTYHDIRIRRVNYRGYNAADWQFTDVSRGQLVRVIDRGFIVEPGRLAYAIDLSGPVAQWRSAHSSLWAGLLRSFRPAPR